MKKEVQEAYDRLVPGDQLVVDAMIITLYQKDKQIRDCVKEVQKFLDGRVVAEQALGE